MKAQSDLDVKSLKDQINKTEIKIKLMQAKGEVNDTQPSSTNPRTRYLMVKFESLLYAQDTNFVKNECITLKDRIIMLKQQKLVKER